ncbi:MAG: acetyl-CoA C-acyltransferase [Proteobacteria bacterium]|nr:acetyl-CoA C-acyltransferase [Pseudomonadota bacterium]
MTEAVIVSAVRTAVGKAPRGTLRYTRSDEIGAAVLKEAVSRAKGLSPEEIDDVIVGCAFPEGDQGLNMARVLALRAGFPDSVPGQTINRFCSSGLQSIATAAYTIMGGAAEVIVAGGVESMTFNPTMVGLNPSPNPYMAKNHPEVFTSMGLTAENVAERFDVSREDQDKFALRSHQNAARAIKEGKFKDEILPVSARIPDLTAERKPTYKEVIFDTDEGVRFETSFEALSNLKPVFRSDGIVTAGNSSQTSDGAAAVVVMSKKKAEKKGIKPMAVFRSYALAGVPPDIMGIGPRYAVPKALKLAGLALDQIDLIELNEAFAAQALYVIRELGMDLERVNVNGGAIALGHPLGCTGTKLTTTLLYEMAKRKARYGLVTMCIGGGMGAAGIFEREA